MCAQTSLYMPHGDLRIKCSKCGGSRRGGVSMNQHDIGSANLKHIPHSCKHTGGNIIQVLPLLHDVEVVVRLHIKYGQHLVEHFSMLTSNANNSFEIYCVLLELFYQWTHLDGLRTSAKN